MSDNNKDLFAYSLEQLDHQFGLPLLWSSPKYSAWYAVGLLARNKGEDVSLANRLLHNIIAHQFIADEHEGHGSFPSKSDLIFPGVDSPWAPRIYASYDPNNALFFVIAGIMIDHSYSHHLSPGLLRSLRDAMTIAVDGDEARTGGEKGDNLYPAYTNAWYMRCVCTAYVAAMNQDERLASLAEEWSQQTINLFNLHGTLSEYNSATYAGVTLFALSLAQYLPPASAFFIHAPRMIRLVWRQIGETYNPSLVTLSGPWDRSYGIDMRQYCSGLGAAITGIIGRQSKYPLPKPLIASEHYEDMAMIPMQMLTAPYMESNIEAEVKAKLSQLYNNHLYTDESIYPPYERRARRYTFWVQDGLSAGGIEFDESVVGGPSINQQAFMPGVIIWDAGSRVGWISVYPTNASCSIVATSQSLSIRYPQSQDYPDRPASTSISLHIGSLPFFSLGKDAFLDGTASLPGLDLTIDGHAVRHGKRYLTFGAKQHNLSHYTLTYDFAAVEENEGLPEMTITWSKTKPLSGYK